MPWSQTFSRFKKINNLWSFLKFVFMKTQWFSSFKSWLTWPRHARDCARLSKIVYIFFSPFTLFLDDYVAPPSLFLNLQNFLLCSLSWSPCLLLHWKNRFNQKKTFMCTSKSTHLPASMPVCSLFPPTPGCTCCWLRPAPPVNSNYSSSSCSSNARILFLPQSVFIV